MHMLTFNIHLHCIKLIVKKSDCCIQGTFCLKPPCLTSLEVKQVHVNYLLVKSSSFWSTWLWVECHLCPFPLWDRVWWLEGLVALRVIRPLILNPTVPLLHISLWNTLYSLIVPLRNSMFFWSASLLLLDINDIDAGEFAWWWRRQEVRSPLCDNPSFFTTSPHWQ